MSIEEIKQLLKTWDSANNTKRQSIIIELFSMAKRKNWAYSDILRLAKDYNISKKTLEYYQYLKDF